MKDKLERYIAEHREELDVHEPHRILWEGVQDKLQRRKRKQRTRYMALAASLLLLVSLIWLRAGMREQTEKTTASANATQNSNNPELFYASVIETKRNELMAYCKDEPVLCSEFKNDLDTLNLHYGMLKQEYNRSANREVVLQAMINNLQMQMQILSQQLYIIQQVKTKEEGKII
jgi:hypothetical protein